MSPTLRRWLPALGLLPFLVYVAVFLIEPTIAVAVGSFQNNDGTWTGGNVSALFESTALEALWHSIELSVASSLLGGVLGTVLAAAIVTLPERSLLRRTSLSLCSVFSQFGGVTLAFMFLATFSATGAVTALLKAAFGSAPSDEWLFSVHGFVVVYLYFQISLMVIVMLPALEGIRAEWGEAAANLGASRWQYFVQVLAPILSPAFLASVLLLFANAFAAYATAAALTNQGQLILPLMIRSSISSEVQIGHQHLAYAIAFEMVIIVGIVMTAYSLLLRRTRRWLG